MTEGGFYQPPKHRRTSIAIVILMHGAAITALALSKMEVIATKRPPTVIDFIDPPKPPPPVIDEPKPTVQPPSNVTLADPIVKPPIETNIYDPPLEPVDPTRFTEVISGNGSDAGPKVDPVPLPEPVRVDASLDRRSELQPPYPASEQRMGAEGLVSLRVVIGPDGRVKAAEKVKATSDAFYQATLRHALRNWRFKPATVDGRPVESSKVMTVRFKIEA